jgi:hypothetical protein
MSTMVTSLPVSLKQAPATRPTYPEPITASFNAFFLPAPGPFLWGYYQDRDGTDKTQTQ